MDLKNKSEKLADRMNAITEKFSENIDTVDEMIITGDDILDFVEEKTQDVDLYTSTEISTTEIINLTNLISDFKYVRETLKENTDNGRRVLTCVTDDLLDEDPENRAELIISFSELNKAIAENMKLYVLSYKEISGVLLNIDKIQKNKTNDPIDNAKTINDAPISTSDLIKELSTNETN